MEILTELSQKWETTKVFLKRHFLSTLMGAILGTILGFCVSQYQVYLSNESDRLNSIQYLAKTVIDELEYNFEWKTDSPVFTIKGDSLPVKRKLLISGLENFMNTIHHLDLDNNYYIDSGRVIFDYAVLINQYIDIRNNVRNDILTGSKKNFGQLVKQKDSHIATLDAMINKGFYNYELFGFRYKAELNQLIKNLK